MRPTLLPLDPAANQYMS